MGIDDDRRVRNRLCGILIERLSEPGAGKGGAAGIWGSRCVGGFCWLWDQDLWASARRADGWKCRGNGLCGVVM